MTQAQIQPHGTVYINGVYGNAMTKWAAASTVSTTSSSLSTSSFTTPVILNFSRDLPPTKDMSLRHYLKVQFASALIRKIRNADDPVPLRRVMLKNLLLARINDSHHDKEIDRWWEFTLNHMVRGVRGSHAVGGLVAPGSHLLEVDNVRLVEVAPYQGILTEDEMMYIYNEAMYVWRITQTQFLAAEPSVPKEPAKKHVKGQHPNRVTIDMQTQTTTAQQILRQMGLPRSAKSKMLQARRKR